MEDNQEYSKRREQSTRLIPQGYCSTQQRTLTKRAVLWPGYICNVRCVFCYNEGMKEPWRKFDGPGGIKEEIDRKRFFYHNIHIDFMGGEFTLHPEVVEIVRYCTDIGIRPTIITNALALSDLQFTKVLQDAGLCDLLVSIHGLGETAERIFNVSKGHPFERQMQALENLKILKIPFRVNTTLIKWNQEQLVDIAQLAVDYGALVVNWINFNPHFAWTKLDTIYFQGDYSSLAEHLTGAIELCEKHNLETNVRYVPFCFLKGFEKNVYNCLQLPYDHHEWDYNSWHSDGEMSPDIDYYNKAAKRQAKENGSIQGPPCQGCALKGICDGFNSQYVSTHGWKEAQPYRDRELVEDPTIFIFKQWKYEEIDVPAAAVGTQENLNAGDCL